jgi:hypothetical protein
LSSPTIRENSDAMEVPGIPTREQSTTPMLEDTPDAGFRSDAPGLRSGTSDRGWEQRELPKNRLDCKRCLRQLERERSS